MTTEYLTELIITQQQTNNNTLLFLSTNFRNLNVIHQSNIEYNIHNYRGNSLVIQMKNYNRGEILNLKAELNSNGYNVNMMTLTSSNYLYVNIVDNQCLTLQHNLNNLDNIFERLLYSSVKILKFPSKILLFVLINKTQLKTQNSRNSLILLELDK